MLRRFHTTQLHHARIRAGRSVRQLGAKLMRLRPVVVLRQLWPFLKPEWRSLLDATVTTLLLTSVEVATPVLVGMFVDSLLATQSGEQATTAWSQTTIIGLLAVGTVLRGYMTARQQTLTGKIGEHVAARMRNRLWAHVQLVPLDYIRRRGPGRLSLRFISDTRMVQRLVTTGMVRLAQDVLLLAAIVVVLLVLNWRMALGVLLVLPIYAIVFRRLNPRLRRESRATRRRRSRLSAYLHDHLTGMVAIKASVRQSTENRRLRALTRSLAKRGTRRAAIGGQVQGFAAGTVAGSGVLVLALAAHEVVAGRLTGGTFVTFYTLLGLIIPVFQRIAVANRTFQEASISIERLMHTLSVKPESPPADDRPPLRVPDGVVALEQVSFRHHDGGPVLEQVSLQARRGELVALVGPNGAGKSTLIDLLLCFRKPNSGHILIDGQDITRVSLASLRSQIGFVSQDAPLFEGTIAQNICYGVQHGIPETHIQHAAQLSGVDRIVATLPDGWDTQVGAGGRALSGGQRQRIALARALAADPPILILDEATSALDAEVEQQLAETLRALAQHKTVIASAHRLPTLLVANRIYVLERGRVVEEGTHATLIGRGGVYTRLFGEAEAVTS